jgi:paraquat-inducible protein B
LQPGRAHILGPGGIEIPDVPHLVEQGLRAQLDLQSFVTGQSEIDLDFDPAAPEVLHPDITDLPEIPTVQSSLQRLTDQLTQLPLRELAANANITMQSLRSLSDDLDRRLPALADSLHATVEDAGQTATVTTAAIQDLRQRLDRMLADSDQLILAGSRQLDQRGAELHALLGQSTATMREGGEVMRDLQTLTASRSPFRMTMESALRDLAAATASLRGFASDVERNPQLLLTGRRP